MKKKYLLTLFFSLFLFFLVMGQNCNPPTGLTVSAVTGTSATIAWNSPIVPSQAEIYIMPAGSVPTWDGGILVATNSFVVTGLVPCTAYQFYVRNICGQNDFSQWAGPFSFTTGTFFNCNATVNGNVVTATATGGSGSYTYSYSLNGGPVIPCASTFTVPSPGIYLIQVSDSISCSCSKTVIVEDTSFSVTIAASLDIPTSTLTALVTGGTAPFTYQWNRNGMSIVGATGESLNVLGFSGVYTVTVTDANGSTATATRAVHGPDIIAVDDTMTIHPDNNSIVTFPVSVLFNDSLVNDGLNYEATTLNTLITPLSVPSGFALNANGLVSVLPGTASGTYVLTYQLCDIYNPNSCDMGIVTVTVINGGIMMNAFIDYNNNGTQEVGEPSFSQGQFGYELNDNGTVHHVVSSNGQYVIGETNTANSYDLTYTVNPDVASIYTLAISSYSNVSLASNTSTVVYNFPLTQMPYNDLEVAVLPSGTPPRPGFAYHNMIVYRNNGNQAIASGTVSFAKNNVVAMINVSPSATATTAAGFTYDFVNLLPGEARYIVVSMQTPTMPTVALGDVLTNSASITIPVGDIAVSNNNSSLSQTIIGSYDPNDKSEAHGGKIVYSGFTANDYLTYTIQFENTGTFYAENVRIEDYLDAKLDETSVKMTSASHGYSLDRVGNHLNWNFIGIDLPPSVANTTTGKGYVSFQVKPKTGFAVGDIIPNTASIFFDFNPAIVTNTFNTEFVSSLGVAEFDNAAFTAYPNPTAGSITVSLKNSTGTIDVATVNDISGKTIKTDAIHKATAVIDLSKLSHGIYFLKIQSEGQEKVMKVVKQ